MILSKATVKKATTKELDNFFKDYGYKFNAKAEGFLRYFNGGFNKIGISVVDYRPKFEVSFYFIIRIDDIEKIIQKFIFVLEQYKEFTWTLNISIDHFGAFKSHPISDENSIHDLVKEVKDVYSNQVDAFLKKYSQISNLDQALNVDHIKIENITNLDDFIRPIIIAKLNNNKDFDKVCEWYYRKYTEEYPLDPDEGPNKIKEAINYLRTL